MTGMRTKGSINKATGKVEEGLLRPRLGFDPVGPVGIGRRSIQES